MPNLNFLTCAKAEIHDTLYCVNETRFQSHTLIFPLIGQCTMSNTSKLFPNTTTCSSFKLIHPIFFVLPRTHTRARTHAHARVHTHTHSYEYFIVVFCNEQCKVKKSIICAQVYNYIHK